MYNNIDRIATDDSEVSIILIDDDQQLEKIKSRPSHCHRKRCTGKYFIGIGIPTIIVVVMIILILLFRQHNRRCGILYTFASCQQPL